MPRFRRRAALALVAALLLALAVVPAAARSGDAAWHRVQLDGRITVDDVTALRGAGAQALQYTPTDAYFAFASPAAARRLEAVDGVTAVRRLATAEKVSQNLRGATGTLNLAVVGHPGALDAADVTALGEVVSRYAVGAGSPLGTVEVRAPAAAALRLAELDAVLHVGIGTNTLAPEDEGTAQVLAGNIENRQPLPGYEAFLASKGLDGEGVTVAIVDDGIDTTHPELTGRVVKRYSYGPENDVVPAQGHGTHVAGIAGGFGAELPVLGRATDSSGLLFGVGVAPKVTFVDQPAIQLATSQTNFPPAGGFPQLSKDSLDAGAIAWNASWTDGGGAGAGYVANAGVMDGIVRDGDHVTDGSQPITLVFSAGNSGSAANTITSPKEAKNIVSVASSIGQRAGDIDRISGFSSRGPALDGRVVPTVTAPGEGISSARANLVGGLCGTEPIVETAGVYSTCSGTSMASPHVAGAVALIHQWWRRDHGVEPSPALDKALLVNSATDMRRADIPNKDEGWGRVNLGALFDDSVERVVVDQSDLLTAVGDRRDLRVEVVDPARPLRATLVWTDAPGAPDAAPALVNDLDLTMAAADGTTFHGNVFQRGTSVPGGEPNRLDNVENVFLDAAAGAYTVGVSAANLPGDGVPGNDTLTDQDYALVLTNARLVE